MRGGPRLLRCRPWAFRGAWIHRPRLCLRKGSDHMRPAIVLSGYTPGLGVARSLAAMAVPVVMVCYGEHDFGGRSRLIDTCLHAPHPETAEKGFINFLVDLGERYPGAVLFP